MPGFQQTAGLAGLASAGSNAGSGPRRAITCESGRAAGVAAAPARWGRICRSTTAHSQRCRGCSTCRPRRVGCCHGFACTLRTGRGKCRARERPLTPGAASLLALARQGAQTCQKSATSLHTCAAVDAAGLAGWRHKHQGPGWAQVKAWGQGQKGKVSLLSSQALQSMPGHGDSTSHNASRLLFYQVARCGKQPGRQAPGAQPLQCGLPATSVVQLEQFGMAVQAVPAPLQGGGASWVHAEHATGTKLPVLHPTPVHVQSVVARWGHNTCTRSYHRTLCT